MTADDFDAHVRSVETQLSGRMRMPVEAAIAEVRNYIVLVEAWSGSPFATKPGRLWSRLSGSRYSPGWLGRLRPDGQPTGLHLVHVIAHLLGSYAIAIPRQRPTRLAIIDLDVHDREAHFTLDERLQAVGAALRHAPCVLVRSSSSLGLHPHYFLDDPHEPAEVRDRVVAALVRGGVAVAPGYVEVLPSAGGLVRLPLGAGSCVLADDTLEPMAAKVDRGGRLRRDLGASLRLFAAMAEKRRVSLEDLVGSAPVIAVPPTWSSVSNSPHPEAGQALAHRLVSSGSALHGADYFASLAASSSGVSAPGNRFDEANRRLFDLFVRQGLPREQVIKAYRRWLVTGQHDSRDLVARPTKTIRRMLADAEGYLDHLEEGVAEGRLTPGGGQTGHRPFDAALLSILYLAEHREGGSWREQALGQLTAADRELLGTVPDPWAARRLGVLVGLLRLGEAEHGPLSRATLSREALKKIVGGRPAPTAASPYAGAGDGPRAAYRVLLDCARRLGLIAPDSPAIRGVRAQVFTIALPTAVVAATGTLAGSRAK